MATYGRLEWQITVPTGGWDTTISGVTATIPAGTYYMSSGGSGANDFLAEVAEQFADAAGVTCAVTASLGEAGTGIVTITFGASASITWVDTEVQELLGFSVNSSAATSHVGTKSARGVWLPTCPFWTKNGGGDWRGIRRGDYRASANAAGHVWAHAGQSRVELDLRWDAIKRSRMWITSESTPNQSLERFWLDGIWGQHGGGTPGGPVRWYPDASADGIYGTYRAEKGAELFDPEQRVENYAGSWRVQLPLLIQVPGTEAIGISGAPRQTITASALTSSSSTADGTSFATASVSPGANRLILAAVATAAGSTPNAPTASGNGLTWVEVATVNYVVGNRRLTVFRAMGSSPSAGAVTFSFAGQTQTSAAWIILQLTNTNTGGTNGSGAVVQSGTATVGAGTSTVTGPTLAALENVANLHVAFVSADINGTVTPDADFTEVADVAVSSGNVTLEAQYALAQTVNVSTLSTTTSSGAGMISIEAKAAES